MISKKSSDENKNIRAVIICGPTGSGKSDLALELALKFNGQIISADSRQIYRRLNIGTAKPSEADISKIRHYLIDVADIYEDFTAKRFADMAKGAIREIIANGQIPFIVGGAGLYLSALTNGLFEGPERDQSFRQGLELRAQKQGSAILHSELAIIDPGSANRISPSDTVRIIRALEVYHLTGQSLTDLMLNGKYDLCDIEFLWVGLEWPRPVLYARIDRRVDLMIENGLQKEVTGLVQDGYGEVLRRKRIVGYYEILDAMEGKYTLSEAIALIKQHSRNYAKRQMTWFRNKANVNWVKADMPEAKAAIFEIINQFLGKMA